LGDTHSGKGGGAGVEGSLRMGRGEKRVNYVVPRRGGNVRTEHRINGVGGGLVWVMEGESLSFP